MLWFFSSGACGITVPPPGIETEPLAVETQSPNHCPARESPKMLVSMSLNFIYLLIYVWLPWVSIAFSSCIKPGATPIAVAILVVEHRFKVHRLQ